MPRIQDAYLRSVVYLYSSADDARSGKDTGGTAFTVSVKAPHSELRWWYWVTASHCVGNQPTLHARMNLQGGGTALYEIGKEEWHAHPNGDDVAACRVPDGDFSGAVAIGAAVFVNQEKISKFNIGPGDETFLVGRFFGHSGKNRNLPCARFGNIASMADGAELVQFKDGRLAECFLVDVRSLNGFSGSPVFVHIPPFSTRKMDEYMDLTDSFTALLGVDTGHLNLPLRSDGMGQPTPQNSGISTVVPAWKIHEVLELPYFKEIQDADLRRAEGGAGAAPRPFNG